MLTLDPPTPKILFNPCVLDCPLRSPSTDDCFGVAIEAGEGEEEGLTLDRRATSSAKVNGRVVDKVLCGEPAIAIASLVSSDEAEALTVLCF